MDQRTRENLVGCFQHSRDISCGVLRERTAWAAAHQRVYLEGFVARQRNPRPAQAQIIVEENTALGAAAKYRRLGRVAVLSFANPVNPGGGVARGRMAQEECLCRSSNLYAALTDRRVWDDFYAYHRGMGAENASDRLIYTPNVIVFKDEQIVPMMLPESEWFAVDVISSAPPYLAQRESIDENALLELLKGRLRNVFEAALFQKVDVLILGAFGCGVFGNPPEIVARAFREVIDENGFAGFFAGIIFAIRQKASFDPNTGQKIAGPNLAAFQRAFANPAPRRAAQAPENGSASSGSGRADYVMLEQGTTGQLYSDRLCLVLVGAKTEREFARDEISVGRGLDCDLRIETSFGGISRKHLTFLRENGIWFARDDGSKNGSWLNGAQMTPGVKYQIKRGDKINLAQQEDILLSAT